MLLCLCNLAWVSDYAQVYFVDADQPAIAGIDEVPTEAMERRIFVAPNGFAVYTADCLRQVIRILIHDAKPEASTTESMSEAAWTRQLEDLVQIPSRMLAISSPSRTGGEGHGPLFRLPAAKLGVRVSWLEINEDRYDAFRAKPDVIQLDLWPA